MSFEKKNVSTSSDWPVSKFDLDSSHDSGLPRHSVSLFSLHTGGPAGPLHGQLLRQQSTGHRDPAAADSRCLRGEPAGLGGSRVAGPGRQGGLPCQLGSLCFSSASPGDGLQAGFLDAGCPFGNCNKTHTHAYMHVYVCGYICTHTRIIIKALWKENALINYYIYTVLTISTI